MKNLGKLTIFETLKEIVDPGHTALVLWDCQDGLVERIFNREAFLSNLGALLTAAREREIPVVFTRIRPLPVAYRSSFGVYQAMKRFNVDDPAKIPAFMEPGSPEALINEALSPAEGEFVLDKHSPSIFFGTVFEQLMRSREIQTVLFTGISTEYGIDHSAREAAVRGFYTVVVSDCVSSPDETTHEMALKIMQRICLVVPSEDILREWA
jgi:nicotinamidase-related amidase